MTEKSPQAFRTISEVADALDVPAHVLRFWESKFSQIKPVKRGGGRRYYRPSDVSLIRGIQTLLYTDGLTIKGVQKILRERGVRHVVNIGDGTAKAFDAQITHAPEPEPLRAVAEPPRKYVPRRPNGTPDLFSEAAPTKLVLDSDVIERVAEIAADESKNRDAIREIVRNLESLGQRMRNQ